MKHVNSDALETRCILKQPGLPACQGLTVTMKIHYFDTWPWHGVLRRVGKGGELDALEIKTRKREILFEGRRRLDKVVSRKKQHKFVAWNALVIVVGSILLKLWSKKAFTKYGRTFCLVAWFVFAPGKRTVERRSCMCALDVFWATTATGLVYFGVLFAP